MRKIPSKKQIRRHRKRYPDERNVSCQIGTNFTLIELLLVITIIAILAALLFPVINNALGKAKETSCLSNLKQMGYAAISYGNEYESYFPPNIQNSREYQYWRYLSTYVGGPQPDTIPAGHSYGWIPDVMRCPSQASRQGGYGGLFSNNLNLCFAIPVFKIKTIQCLQYTTPFYKAPNFILMADSSFKPTNAAPYDGHVLAAWGGQKYFTFVHKKRGNAAFMDGHASSLELSKKYVNNKQYVWPVANGRGEIKATPIYNYRLYDGTTFESPLWNLQ